MQGRKENISYSLLSFLLAPSILWSYWNEGEHIKLSPFVFHLTVWFFSVMKWDIKIDEAIYVLNTFYFIYFIYTINICRTYFVTSYVRWNVLPALSPSSLRGCGYVCKNSWIKIIARILKLRIVNNRFSRFWVHIWNTKIILI